MTDLRCGLFVDFFDAGLGRGGGLLETSFVVFDKDIFHFNVLLSSFVSISRHRAMLGF